MALPVTMPGLAFSVSLGILLVLEFERQSLPGILSQHGDERQCLCCEIGSSSLRACLPACSAMKRLSVLIVPPELSTILSCWKGRSISLSHWGRIKVWGCLRASLIFELFLNAISAGRELRTRKWPFIHKLHFFQGISYKSCTQSLWECLL